MLDFIKIEEKAVPKSKTADGGKSVYVRPSFIVGRGKGIMIRARSFYAIWDEENDIWSTNEFDVIGMVDKEIDKYIANEQSKHPDWTYIPCYMTDFSSSTWTNYKKYISLMPDEYKPLDQKIVFADYKSKRSDYISRKLPYTRSDKPCPAYTKLMNKLYDPEERAKIEWAIGCIFSGDSLKLHKFIVLKGKGGTGKSTVLNIIDKLFEGYTSAFDAKDLVMANNQFAGDAFENDPLVGISSDADLSNVKDNSVLNKIVGHDKMVINVKFKPKFELRPHAFLFVGSNKDVKITDARSGLIRRIIDVHPTGNLFSQTEYDRLIAKIDGELGSIADHCIKTYEEMGKTYYNSYKPLQMMYNTDPVFNFVEEHYLEYKRNDAVQLQVAYNDYKRYCSENQITHILKKYEFKDELGNYFKEFHDMLRTEDASRLRSCFTGFNTSMFESKQGKEKDQPTKKNDNGWLDMEESNSDLDDILKDCPAQYAAVYESGGKTQVTPKIAWSKCETTLKDIDTTQDHYSKMPENMIVLDFDIKDESGNKNAQLNIEEAKKWPPTYAEFSKSGAGIHLHYYYDGDIAMLADSLKGIGVDADVKKQVGNTAIRRKLTRCINLPIAHLKEGDLPLKKVKNNMYNKDLVRNEKYLRGLIKNCINKEHHSNTREEINYIYQELDAMYNSGIPYDVENMKMAVIQFAANSTNQSDTCLKMVSKMHFKSEDCEEHSFDAPIDITEDAPIVFFDIECFPNLFLINWKFEGEGKKIVRMINPTPEEVKELFQYRLVGFNNRDYDNHMIFAASLGKTNRELYNLSKKLIGKDKVVSREAKFMQAYGLSYTDIYDYAKKKQSLKKWEIELGIHHQELGLDWDSPVPENLWPKVAEYCDNDVIATEAVWNATQGDFLARKILAEIAGGKPNDKTNKLSAMFIFEGNKHPQAEFEYRFMGEPEEGQENLDIWDDGITAFQPNGKPVFIGYKFERGKSSYLDVEEVGEGGYVFAEEREVINDKGKPEIQVGGMYDDVWTFDVASQHPSSIIAENLFGDYYTARFKEILELRIAIKHGELDRAKQMFGGALAKYLDNPEMADALAGALKIVINSVYGLTSAKFENEFKDPRNIDNIVAKRGALFMINLRNLVQKMGYTVVHCKTDSIKVAHPDEKIKKFITDYGKAFGYNFEVEHIFEKICLVNNAVYIAKLSKDDPEWIKDCEKAKAKGKPEPTRWTATGTQFQVPYVFKSLFSGEDIEFSDMCETKSVSDGGLIYLDFDETLPDVSEYERILQTRKAIASDKKVTLKAKHEAEEYNDISDSQLKSKIAKGHDYRFVGKVGLFCPVKAGCGGAIMYRYDSENDKYSAVTGTKDYRWIEAEVVRDANLEECIDKSYYDALLDDAVRTISKYGDYEWFVA